MTNNFPKISIVTPVFNQKEYIEACINSILNQNYPNLEYIIIDGGSTDGTLDIINKYASGINYTISEPDKGLYDALRKGFAKTTGEIMGWLNSDDLLHAKSLFTIAEIFETNNKINWLQGLPTVVDAMNRVVFSRSARYDKFDFFLKEYHDGKFVQQESTYWRRNLWEDAGAKISLDYKYAGDFELWMRFFEHASLYCTSAMIGAFRYRGKGQMSNDHYAEYLKECDIITDKAVVNLSETDTRILNKQRKYKRRSKRIFRLSKWMCGAIPSLQADGRHEINFDFKNYMFKKQ